MRSISRHILQDPRKTAGIVVGAVIAMLLVGGGVYAGIGGVIRSQSSTDVELQRGLVGWWKLNGNAKDSTPYASDGTVNSATLTTDRKAATNSAYLFATGNTISVPHNTVHDITGDVTVAAWIKPSVTFQSSFARVVTNYDGTQINYLLSYDNAGKMRFIVDGDSRAIALSTTTINNTSQWYHIMGVRSGNDVRLYINGVLESTASTTGANKITTTPLYIGGGVGNSFQGSMDDVRIYNRALNTNEMNTLYRQYDATFKIASGEKGLVGWWRMEGNAKDATPNANNGTISGATLTTDRKDTANAAYSFNGSSYINIPSSTALNSAVYTISAWVKPTTATSGTILGSPSSGNPQLRLEASNKLTLLKQNNVQFTSSTGSVTLNQWAHVAVTYDAAGNFVYYINGQASGSGTNLQSFTFSNYRIGLKASTEGFIGSIDDVRIYNRVLSAAELGSIAKSYNSQANVRPTYGTSGSVNLSSGLAGYWAMNGNPNDSSPNSNNATVVGTTLTTDRKAQASRAFIFTGAPQYLQVGPSSVLSFTNNFTISAWVYPTSYRTTGYFGLKNGIIARGPASTYNYAMQATDATTVSFVKRTGAESLQYTNFINVPSLTNKWTLLTMTVSGGSVKLYVNGVLHGTGSVGTISPGGSDNLYIGTMTNSQSESAFIGSIDDVRIYNRVLTTAEISALRYTYF